MSWDDDYDADEFGERRPVRAKTTGWQAVRRVGGYAGVVVGVLALAVGAVFAVNALGVAAKPGGFAAPAVSGPSVTHCSTRGMASAMRLAPSEATRPPTRRGSAGRT